MARSVFAKLPTCCGKAMDPTVGSLSPNAHSAITRNLVCPLGGHHLLQGKQGTALGQLFFLQLRGVNLLVYERC